MSKTIKCIFLKIDVVLISEIVEVPSELGEPDCKLIDPYRFYDNENLKPWPDITDQREIMIHSDSILTIVEPKPKVVEKYLELIAR